MPRIEYPVQHLTTVSYVTQEIERGVMIETRYYRAKIIIMGAGGVPWAIMAPEEDA
jgi:hypothetical protein